jgi:hypothetical protein
VDVTVIGPGGASTTSSADQFTYTTAPAVSSVSPATGATSGGTPVTITGAGFTGATAVHFGTVAASNVVVNSATQVTATSPAESAGTVDVTVIGPGGASATSPADHFTFGTTVTAVSSTQAAGAYTAGATVPITITFSEAVTVTGTPQLTLNDGAAANYVSGSGTPSLTFNYSVATGQNTADLDYASTGALALNGGNIRDAGGNAAVLTLPATGTDGLATRNIVIDTTPPSGYSITPEFTAFNALTATGAGFTFSGAEIGATYNYTITSTGGGTAVTGSGTISSATQAVNGIDLVSTASGNTPLGNGTVTFSVTLTDAAGNVGVAAATTATLNTSVPPAFTVTPDETTYTSADDTNFGFTLANAEVNDTYTYSLLLRASQTAIRGSGTVTAASMQFSGIDISSLSSGSYTLHVILTNGASNARSENATVILNKAIPSFTITPTYAGINDQVEHNDSFTFAGAEVGTTYKYTINSSGGSGSVSGSGSVTSATQTVTGIDVSTLPDGTVTYSVTLTDALGNVSSPVTATAVLYLAAPGGYSITLDAPIFNATTAKTAGFTLGNAGIGDIVNYVFNSNVTGHYANQVTGTAAVTSTTQDIIDIDISSFPSGQIVLTVNLINPEGNSGPFAQATGTLDLVLPGGYTIKADQGVIGPGAAAAAGFTFTGATVGDVYACAITSSGGGGTITGSGPIASASQDITPINVSALPDGTLTYAVSLTSPDYNTGAVVTATALLEQHAPTGFTVTPDLSTINAVSVSSSGFTLSGAKVGDTYSYSISGIGGSPVTGNITASTQDITGIDLSSLADGTVTYSVTLSDAGGTSSPVTATATIDREAPTAIALSTSVAPANAALGTQVAVLQTVGPESSSAYTYALVSGAGGTDNGSFQISGDELLTNAVFSSTGQSTYSIRLQSSDSLGNSVQQQFLITISNTDPITPSVTISGSSAGTSIAANQTGAGAAVGTLATTAPAGGIEGSQINYSLVSDPGSPNNNNLFQIVNGQLQTTGTLTAGTYTVRVRSTSTFLISDVVDLSGVNGPYAFQVSLDPTQLPSSSFAQLAADAGLITLSSDAAGSWNPAVSTNLEAHGSLAQPNYQGSYASFWSTVTAANPSATLQNVVGSSGVDLAATQSTGSPAAWAVVDQPGNYAVGVQVYTEKVFTITVTP